MNPGSKLPQMLVHISLLCLLKATHVFSAEKITLTVGERDNQHRVDLNTQNLALYWATADLTIAS